MKNLLIIKLDADHPDGLIRVMSDRVNLAEGRSRSVETITRAFKFPADHFYGEIEINRKKMQQMISNFTGNTYGQPIYVNIAHRDCEGAAGEITRLFQEGNKLRGEIDWTELGLDAIHKRGFRFFSAEFVDDYEDPETEKRHGAVLLGAALTIRPRVKRLDPINPDKLMLSEDPDEDAPIFILPNVKKLLSEEITTMWKDLIAKLEEDLKKINLSDENRTKLTDGFKKSVENITDEPAAKALQEAILDTARSLADKGDGDKAITINFPAPAAGTQLSEEAINKLVADKMVQLQDDAAKTAKQLAEKKESNIALLHSTIDAAEGLKVLGEEDMQMLLCDDLITAEMTEDQVKKLAEHQINLGNRMAVSKQLAARGFNQPQGTVHITVDESNKIKALQETMDKNLGLTDMPESRRFQKTGGALLSENKEFADKVLALYDRNHAKALHEEAVMLAGGSGVVADVSVPVSWERTVIREALYNLTVLPLLDVGTLEFATAYTIPYSYRDTTGAGIGDTRKYQGQAINQAGVIQTSETAYNTPQKLSFEVSDELRYLTRTNALNWEAVSENQRNASRIIGEDLDRLGYNEMLQAADEYGAVAVASESHTAETDGAHTTFALTNFPVVRPRKVYDLEGNQVGSTTNPITVTYNAAALVEYDGTGTQGAGTYYSLDYNLGLLQIVNQLGAVQVPAAPDTLVVDYSYSTNVKNWNTDLGTDTAEIHWDDFLYYYGLRKTVIEDDRYHMANMGFMRGTPMTNIGQAKKFQANYKVPGTDMLADGSLGRIKDVPNFKAFGPNLDMADHRIVVGERGTTRMRMAKPWTMGDLENQRDANGKFTGKKTAYGDQFIVIHTPTQLKRALTSLNLYSATTRVTS